MIDVSGIRYQCADKPSLMGLAALPGPSLLDTDAEVALLGAGVRPIRNSFGLVVAIQLRCGATFPYLPDAGPGQL
jgi:hypothetical protein